MAGDSGRIKSLLNLGMDPEEVMTDLDSSFPLGTTVEHDIYSNSYIFSTALLLVIVPEFQLFSYEQYSVSNYAGMILYFSITRVGRMFWAGKSHGGAYAGWG